MRCISISGETQGASWACNNNGLRTTEQEHMGSSKLETEIKIFTKEFLQKGKLFVVLVRGFLLLASSSLPWSSPALSTGGTSS